MVRPCGVAGTGRRTPQPASSASAASGSADRIVLVGDLIVRPSYGLTPRIDSRRRLAKPMLGRRGHPARQPAALARAGDRLAVRPGAALSPQAGVRAEIAPVPLDGSSACGASLDSPARIYRSVGGPRGPNAARALCKE